MMKWNQNLQIKYPSETPKLSGTNKLTTYYFSKQNLLCLVISLIIFIFDRFTKINVLKNFSEQKSYFINDLPPCQSRGKLQ